MNRITLAGIVGTAAGIAVFSAGLGAVLAPEPAPVVRMVPFASPSPSPVASASPVASPSPVIVISVSPSPSPVRVTVVQTPAARSANRELSGMALRVADCESGDRLSNGRAVAGSYNPTAQNPTSSASGAFQFINSTWRSVTGRSDRAKDAPMAVQIAAFEKLWAGGAGSRHWAPSRGCWS